VVIGRATAPAAAAVGAAAAATRADVGQGEEEMVGERVSVEVEVLGVDTSTTCGRSGGRRRGSRRWARCDILSEWKTFSPGA